MQNEIGRYGDIIEAKKEIYMNARIVNMLEAIKVGTYIIYTDIDAICQWSYPIISGNRDEIEKMISLMYELYVREDIDFFPYEEYTRIISYLSTQYNFDKNDFLSLYSAFRKLVFEG